MVTGYCEKHAGYLHKLHGQNSDCVILKKVMYITFSSYTINRGCELLSVLY